MVVQRAVQKAEMKAGHWVDMLDATKAVPSAPLMVVHLVVSKVVTTVASMADLTVARRVEWTAVPKVQKLAES